MTRRADHVAMTADFCHLEAARVHFVTTLHFIIAASLRLVRRLMTCSPLDHSREILPLAVAATSSPSSKLPSFSDSTGYSKTCLRLEVRNSE